MMIAWLLIPFVGVAAAWLLFRKVPPLPPSPANTAQPRPVSIVIPARNEEANLPRLLESIRTSSTQLMELIVVDDHSTDATAVIAAGFGATVIAAQRLPPGWTGKTWACQQGAVATRGATLLFLDADTYFDIEGLSRLLALHPSISKHSAVSLLPYHRTERPYEQLSLFFNLIMAAGAGGFSALVHPGLFGQCLLIDRELYQAAGGHAAVRSHVLENLHLAAPVRASGGSIVAALGRGVVSMRMFSGGIRQLVAGWQKGFAAGAASTPTLTVVLISLWITGLCLAVLNLILVPTLLHTASPHRTQSLLLAAALYAIAALHVFALARRVGSFSAWAALLYPAFLVFYVAVFLGSVLARRSHRGVEWKGRRV